jgi:Tol biopolymer transport system component
MLSRLALRFSVLTMSVVTLAACNADAGTGTPESVTVASVTVSPSPLTLAPGASRALSATPKDASGAPLTGRAVQWSSSNAYIVSVSPQGMVTAHAAGSADIRATSEGKTGSATIAVVAATPPPAEVVSVGLDVATATIDEGDVHQFVATPRDADGAPIAGLGMQWTSSDATVAAVSAVGVVTGVRPGSATITVRVHGKTASAVVTIVASYSYDLLYSDYDNGGLQLFALDFSQASATPARLLPAGTWAEEARPSPDGSKITFVGSVDGMQGIYVMNRDGSALKRIVAPLAGPVSSPTWSPDGMKIAFQGSTGGTNATRYDIHVVNADGTSAVNLTAELGYTDQLTPAWSPAFSSGGSRIAFVHRANGVERVWTMRADGSDKKQVTAGVLDLQPSWSPNGQTIVFSRTNAVNNGDVWLVDAGGTNERPVMQFYYTLAGPQMHPTFSPDGRMIAFASQHETWATGNGELEIFTIWADGSKLARRTAAGGMWPAWIAK